MTFSLLQVILQQNTFRMRGAQIQNKASLLCSNKLVVNEDKPMRVSLSYPF